MNLNIDWDRLRIFYVVACQYALKNDPLCARKIDPPWEVL